MTRRFELYGSLRIALYLLVASGALAVSWVEGRPVWLALVVLAALCARWTVDRGTMRPMHPNVGSVLALLLVLYFCYAALGSVQAGKSREAVLQLARLFCGVQVILFFSPFRPSMTWIYFGCNLLVLLLSGLLLPGPSLLARMLAFYFCLAQALLLHGLLRSEGAVHAARQQQLGRHAGESQPRQWLSGALLARALLLSLSGAVVCLLCGLLLFFVWPRFADNDPRGRAVDSDQRPDGERDTPTEGLAEALAGLPRTVGFSPELSLENLGPLRPDASQALKVVADGPLRQLASPSGYLYLRGLAYAVYSDNRWQPVTKRGLRLRSPERQFIELPGDAPHFLVPAGRPKQLALHLEPLSPMGRVLFASAPVRRVRPPERADDRLMVDAEGMLQAGVDLEPGDPWCSYSVHSYTPVWPEDLGPQAQAMLPDSARRYVEWTSRRAPEIMAMAAELTRDLDNDAAKALAIRDHLRSSGRYRYTRFLNTLQHGSARVADFLFAEDPKQRAGHCGYFATAMVLLARAAGLPARVAIGFASPTSDEGSELVVLNAQAHAWAELYFAQAGWVVFEATPAGEPETDLSAAPMPGDEGTLARDAPALEAESNAVAVEPASETGAEPEEAEGWQYLTAFDGGAQRRLFSRLGTRAAPWSLPALVLALLGGLLWWLWKARKPREATLGRHADLPARSRNVVRFYGRLLQILASHGFRRAPGETPRELADRVLREGGSAFRAVRLVTTGFERVRYGDQTLSREELAELKSALRRVPTPE